MQNFNKKISKYRTHRLQNIVKYSVMAAKSDQNLSTFLQRFMIRFYFLILPICNY